MNPVNIPPVAVLGTGIAGLTAAIALREAGLPVVVYEAGSRIAGLATTFKDPDGFTYDFGAHFITNRLAKAVGVTDQCRDVVRYGESVLLRGKTYTYPLGLARVPRFVVSAIATRLGAMGKNRNYSSVREAFTSLYGKCLAEEVAIPLVESWSGAPATELASSVAEKIPTALLHVVALKLLGIIKRRAIAIGYCKERPTSAQVWHVYPEGGLSTICKHLASRFGADIYLDSPIHEIYVQSDEVRSIQVRGRRVEVSAVISTAPVDRLAKLVRGTAKLESLAKFRYRAMAFVNLKFRGRGILPDVVLWTPAGGLPFFRLTEVPLAMPWLAPEGKTLITADMGCVVGDRIWSMSEEELGELCLEALERIVPNVHGRYLGCTVLRTPYAYPIFLNEYEEERIQFQRSTGIHGLYSLGRNGEFDHLLSEDVYWRTLAKAPKIIESLRDQEAKLPVKLHHATA